MLKRKDLFNENGDTVLTKRQIIGGNTTNLNDFNNIKYTFTSDWYRQAMNNFWIPEEINLTSDIKDYRNLEKEEKRAFDKILSFLIFLDSLQTANLPNLGEFITANEINLCLNIQTYQEAIHSQSYGYILDTICEPQERDEILYQWKDDEVLLSRNRFIGDKYNDFFNERTEENLMKTLIANYILEGIYFYSGFMFFYALGRINKMPGVVQEIRYINRDENTHLWLFRSIILELKKERKHLFTEEKNKIYKKMIEEGVEEEIKWAKYAIGENIKGLTMDNVTAYLKYLGNLRSQALGLGIIYEGYENEPDEMSWVSKYSDPNGVKTDFFEAKVSAYAKSSVIEDDL
ncbi:ribonucleotide-diphosphate reductase subunit beta [Citroniella saccharovorans]|uniref:Ribonucleoside-diphosphate reductase subunit beta n=1 Tax=Citroniella saccharovorans TaxID=2053367 RepID=A0AAW9MPF2_9FIRM|nr:ribonucleotide-diphosphate reductase subunit beta [Citroniella saccharovorans]MEB3428944.1 ribonucleotide-diphosphate reductase subunit beta [Citroniella saccharovorans]